MGFFPPRCLGGAFWGKANFFPHNQKNKKPQFFPWVKNFFKTWGLYQIFLFKMFSVAKNLSSGKVLEIFFKKNFYLNLISFTKGRGEQGLIYFNKLEIFGRKLMCFWWILFKKIHGELYCFYLFFFHKKKNGGAAQKKKSTHWLFFFPPPTP